jgi:acylphosphatase
MSAANQTQRRSVYYSGHVQGVGFRYTARAIAFSFDVTGFIRNLADGRVELVAEGKPSELDEFLIQLRDHMSGHIRDIKIDTQPATGEFMGFEVRH